MQFDNTLNIRDVGKVQDSMRLFSQLKTQFEPLHRDMTKNYNMTCAKFQLDPDVRAELEDDGRSISSHNLTRPILRALTSLESNGRKRLVLQPVSALGDTKIASVLTEVLFDQLDKAEFDQIRSRVFKDSIIAKFGMYRLGWRYDKDPMGSLYIDAVDPRTVMFKMDYNDITLTKCNFVLEKSKKTIEELLEIYAANNLKLQEAILKEAEPFINGVESGKKDRAITSKLRLMIESIREFAMSGDNMDGSNGNYYNSDYNAYQWFDPVTMEFDVIELHEKRTERRLIITNPESGQEEDITESVMVENGSTFDREKVNKIFEERKIQRHDIRMVTDKWITTTAPALNLVLQNMPYPIKCDHFLYIPQFCYDYHADLTKVQSIMDDLIDPQSEYNKARNLQLEMLARYNNLGYIYEDGAIDGFEDHWENKGIGTLKPVNIGYWDKVKSEQHQTIPRDLINETQTGPNTMQYIAGTPPSLFGLSEGERSGRLYTERRNQAERSFIDIFEQVDRASKAIGKVSVKLIQTFMPMATVIRIAQDEGEPQTININQEVMSINPMTGMPIIKKFNDITVGEFDVKISNAPYSSTAKEMEFFKLMDLYQIIQATDPLMAKEALPIIIKASDTAYKNDLLMLLNKQATGQMNPQEQFALMMQQIQQFLAKLEVEKEGLKNQGEKLKNQGLLIDNQSKLLDMNLKKRQQRFDEKKNILGMLLKPQTKAG